MSQPLTLTVLVENTARRRGLLAEHGLAFWLETADARILFDAGQTNVLSHNAEALGIDLASTDAIVLSHGHYDHSGGLGSVLARAPAIPLFAHPAALDEKYGRNADGGGRYLGIPADLRHQLAGDSRFVPVEEPSEVAEGCWVTGPIPRRTAFEDTGGAFFTDPECRQTDELIDDQAAFLKTPQGLIVILGCAHAGIINTLNTITQLVPELPIRSVIGGTHLAGASEQRMSQTVKALRDLGSPRLFPLHCTGFQAAARLWQEFPGRVESCPVGTRLLTICRERPASILSGVAETRP